MCWCGSFASAVKAHHLKNYFHIQFSLRRDAFRLKSTKFSSWLIHIFSLFLLPFPSFALARALDICVTWCWHLLKPKAAKNGKGRRRKKKFSALTVQSFRRRSDSETETFHEIRRKREKSPCIWSLVNNQKRISAINYFRFFYFFQFFSSVYIF